MASSLFGTITPPAGVDKFASTANGEGIYKLINVFFMIATTIAGIYLIAQLIMAGFSYLNANGDPKRIAAAWEKIWQSILGLVIIVAAFAIAGLVGKILGIDILNPTNPTLK